MRVYHEFGPFYDSFSKILILGSFPSVKSREVQFYYGHPQNRFWRVLSACLNDSVPESIEQKKSFLIKHHIALWDVIESCEITGSSDASIRNVNPTNMKELILKTDIQLILVNGKTAWKYYTKFHRDIGVRAYCMPSTSPANARMRLDDLINEWKILKEI